MRTLGPALASALVAVSIASVAAAQEPPAPPSVPPPPPASAVAPGGEFVAPLEQRTQQTYVPQSVALSGPNVIRDWEEGDGVPPGYKKGYRTRNGLIVGGAVSFGVLYLISAFTAAATVDGCSSCMKAEGLFVPVVGPFIEMGRTGKGSAVAEVALAVDGLGQVAGAAMLFAGLTMPKVVLVRNDLAGAEPKLAVQPFVAGKAAGLRGSF